MSLKMLLYFLLILKDLLNSVTKRHQSKLWECYENYSNLLINNVSFMMFSSSIRLVIVMWLWDLRVVLGDQRTL